MVNRRAHCQLAGVALSVPAAKGRDLFVAGWHPFNGSHTIGIHRSGRSGVASDAPDLFLRQPVPAFWR